MRDDQQETGGDASRMRKRDVHVVACNLRGWAVGQDHPGARHPDSLVARVREMRAGGATHVAIALATGVCASTVGRWCRGERRNVPAVRYIARPVRLKQFAIDGQSDPAMPGKGGHSVDATAVRTVKLTDEELR